MRGFRAATKNSAVSAHSASNLFLCVSSLHSHRATVVGINHRLLGTSFLYFPPYDTSTGLQGGKLNDMHVKLYIYSSNDTRGQVNYGSLLLRYVQV